MFICVYEYVLCTYVGLCVHACVCVRACVHVCVCVCLHAYVRACVRVRAIMMGCTLLGSPQGFAASGYAVLISSSTTRDNWRLDNDESIYSSPRAGLRVCGGCVCVYLYAYTSCRVWLFGCLNIMQKDLNKRRGTTHWALSDISR